MKSIIKLIANALCVGAIMASCGTKERTLEDYHKEAEVFKSGLPESYVVLGECIDTLVQKIYYTNRVSPWEECYPWQEELDEINDDMYPRRVLELQRKDNTPTFIKVYNINTHDTTDVDLSKFNGAYGSVFDDGQIGIRFKHYANGKLYISVPEARDGCGLYCINVYSDEMTLLCGGKNFHIEGDKIVYSTTICVNPEDFGYQQVFVDKELSIDL